MDRFTKGAKSKGSFSLILQKLLAWNGGDGSWDPSSDSDSQRQNWGGGPPLEGILQLEKETEAVKWVVCGPRWTRRAASERGQQPR